MARKGKEVRWKDGKERKERREDTVKKRQMEIKIDGWEGIRKREKYRIELGTKAEKTGNKRRKRKATGTL